MRPDHRFALMIATGTFLVYLAFLAPGIYSIDGNSMLAVAESLVTNHTFTVPANLGLPGVGGRIYSSWYPLLSLLAVPFVFAALFVGRLSHLPFHYMAAMMALPLNSALTAATAGVVALLSIRLGATRKGAWLAAVCFGFATIALVYARTFFAEPLLSFMAASALYLAMGRTQKAIWGASLLAGMAVLAKPTGIVVGPVLTTYLLARRVSLRDSAPPALGTAAGFLVYLGYNLWRFGQPMNFGQAWLFNLAFVPSSVAGLLASPGWGLVWYCPALVLCGWGFREAMRSQLVLEALAIVALFVGFLLVHALYKNWNAGWAWGPRYLLPAIPGLCALTGIVQKQKKALAVLTVVGFLINAPTMFSFYERYLAELSAEGVATNESLAWSLRRAPVFHGWQSAWHEVRDARSADVRQIFDQRGAPSQTIGASRALRVVAVWWWVLPIAGIPRWVGFLVCLGLTSLGVYLIAVCRAERSVKQWAAAEPEFDPGDD